MYNVAFANSKEDEIVIDTTYYKATPWNKQSDGMYIVSIYQSGKIYSEKIIKN